MDSNLTPSTGWQEHVAADEEHRYEGYARVLAEIQERMSKRWGTGRALHRKQITAAHGTLDVLSDLPAFAAHGLFADPGIHEAWVRLSNAGWDRAEDSMPDLRGVALKVFGVHGDSALGNGPAQSQDFTLFNQEVFGFTGSDEFVSFLSAATHGYGALVKYLFKRYGAWGAVVRLRGRSKALGAPFGGFAVEPMFSGVPIACGPYAVRVRLLPAAGNGAVNADAQKDLNADFSARLARQVLHWDLQLQPFVNETLTPIENPSVNWPTPYTTVARLVLPPQETESAEGRALAQRVEANAFDPWHALAAHRPLGDVQRARRVVYFQSQKGRGAA